MEFVKVATGKYELYVDGELVGTMDKDSSRANNFEVVAQLNFNVAGYVNRKSGKSFKAVKPQIEKLYYYLMSMRETDK